MKKRFLYVLLLGAMVFTSAGIVSCSDDNDDLDSRVTVIEGLLKELSDKLAALQSSGATVASAEQDENGVWTLTLSNGTKVEIAAGGGSGVSVVENDNNFIITVNGKEYVLPKGSAAAQLIYSPQYDDGIEVIDATGSIKVKFMVNPAITAEEAASATYDIQEAHELQTRAGSDYFKIDGTPTVEDGFLVVPVKALDVKADKTYAVSIVMTLKGTNYISNYFRVKIGDEYSFNDEALEDYSFASIVANPSKAEETRPDGTSTWTWTAVLPKDLVEDFSFADFFTNLPSGVQFEIARVSKQVGNAAKADPYNVLVSSLSKDGKWSLTGRPGCAFPDGILINIVQNDVVKMKVLWIHNDPLAGLSLKGNMTKLNTHMEARGATNDGSDLLPAGVNDIDIPAMLTQAASNDAVIPIRHGDAGSFIKDVYPNYSGTFKETGDIIYYDGTRYVAGETGAKYAKNSRGVYWTSHQISIASSNRRNLERPADEGSDDNIKWCGGNCNGEIIGGFDGIPGEDRVAYGIDVTDDGHIRTTANYKGWAFRAGFWLKYEYAYGEIDVAGSLFWVWVNRRSCPADVTDPTAR